jgi:hypothetical protein
MNDEEFEDKLRALTAKLGRPDPTQGWKADILSHARHSREGRLPGAPRLLVVVLGAAWLLIAILRFTTPSDMAVMPTERSTTPLAAREDSALRMLIAFRSNPSFLDMP